MGELIGAGLVGMKGVLDGWPQLFESLRTCLSHPASTVRQAASMVMQQVGSLGRNVRNLKDPPVPPDTSPWPPNPPLLVLGALSQWWEQEDPLTRQSRGARKASKNVESFTWETREGILMTYEGLLKEMLQQWLLEVAASTGILPTMRGQLSVGSIDTKTEQVGGAGTGARAGGGVGIGEGSRCSIRKAKASRIGAEHGDEKLPSLLWLVVMQVEGALLNTATATPTSPPSCRAEDGRFELRRAGVQVLPVLGRALAWWDPAALVRLSARVEETNHQCERRNRLLVVCELLRSSVRYARNLAELHIDTAYCPSSRHSAGDNDVVSREAQVSKFGLPGSCGVGEEGTRPMVGNRAQEGGEGPGIPKNFVTRSVDAEAEAGVGTGSGSEP
ncbi:unnamed protein product, partial [Discosporangium mesarthrocarpum]